MADSFGIGESLANLGRDNLARLAAVPDQQAAANELAAGERGKTVTFLANGEHVTMSVDDLVRRQQSAADPQGAQVALEKARAELAELRPVAAKYEQLGTMVNGAEPVQAMASLLVANGNNNSGQQAPGVADPYLEGADPAMVAMQQQLNQFVQGAEATITAQSQRIEQLTSALAGQQAGSEMSKAVSELSEQYPNVDTGKVMAHLERLGLTAENAEVGFTLAAAETPAVTPASAPVAPVAGQVATPEPASQLGIATPPQTIQGGGVPPASVTPLVSRESFGPGPGGDVEYAATVVAAGQTIEPAANRFPIG